MAPKKRRSTATRMKYNGPVEAHIARGFLTALRNEYVNIDVWQPVVGDFFQKIADPEAEETLLPFEEECRAAGDANQYILDLAARWFLEVHILAIDDKVVAKFPKYRGTEDNPWFAATVVEIDYVSKRATVMYEDSERLGNTSVTEEEILYAPERPPSWGQDEQRGNTLVPDGAVVIKIQEVEVKVTTAVVEVEVETTVTPAVVEVPMDEPLLPTKPSKGSGEQTFIQAITTYITTNKIFVNAFPNQKQSPRCETIQSSPYEIVKWTFTGTFSGKWYSASGTEYQGKGQNIEIEGLYILGLGASDAIVKKSELLAAGKLVGGTIFCNADKQILAALYCAVTCCPFSADSCAGSPASPASPAKVLRGRVPVQDVLDEADKKFKKLYTDPEEFKTTYNEFKECAWTMDPDGDGIGISDIVEAVEMKMVRKKMLEEGKEARKKLRLALLAVAISLLLMVVLNALLTFWLVNAAKDTSTHRVVPPTSESKVVERRLEKTESRKQAIIEERRPRLYERPAPAPIGERLIGEPMLADDDDYYTGEPARPPLEEFMAGEQVTIEEVEILEKYEPGLRSKDTDELVKVQAEDTDKVIPIGYNVSMCNIKTMKTLSLCLKDIEVSSTIQGFKKSNKSTIISTPDGIVTFYADGNITGTGFFEEVFTANASFDISSLMKATVSFVTKMPTCTEWGGGYEYGNLVSKTKPEVVPGTFTKDKAGWYDCFSAVQERSWRTASINGVLFTPDTGECKSYQYAASYKKRVPDKAITYTCMLP